MKLNPIEIRELHLLIGDPRYGSSDRDRDRARAKLKRLGAIRFNRKTWSWEVLPEGRAVLSREGGEK